MADSAFTWIRPPKALGNDVRAWGDRMLDALYELAIYFATRFEAYAKANAPWKDRTSHARQGLRSRAVRFGAIVFIYVYHTMTYGIWLEIAMAGKYAILLPTIERHLAELMTAMHRLGSK